MAGSVVFMLAPYHVLSYGTLLGTSVFHSFINGTTMFRVLGRPEFATVQYALFPIYFAMQSTIPVVLALTYPPSQNSSAAAVTVTASSLKGVLDPSNRLTVLAPLGIMFATGLGNLLVMLPVTRKCMAERHRQEKKDGKRSYDAPPHSQEMLALNKRFGKLHGTSALLNLGTIVATIAYGFHLASRLD